jgi:hypothetical protein
MSARAPEGDGNDRGRVDGVITRHDLLVPIPEQGSYESPLAGPGGRPRGCAAA